MSVYVLLMFLFQLMLFDVYPLKWPHVTFAGVIDVSYSVDVCLLSPFERPQLIFMRVVLMSVVRLMFVYF